MKEKTTRQITYLIERVARLVTSDAHAAGLQPVQWEVIRYLDRANRFSRTPAAVAAYLGLTKGTVSQSLIALESKGYLRKVTSVKDRRSKRLELTAKAKKILNTDPLRDRENTIAALSSSAQQALQESLSALLVAELRKRDRKPFGLCKNCVYFSSNDANGQPHRCKLLDEPLSNNDSLSICFEQTGE